MIIMTVSVIICILPLGVLFWFTVWSHVVGHAVHMRSHIGLWEWSGGHREVLVPHHVVGVCHIWHVCTGHLVPVHHLRMLLVWLMMLRKCLGRGLELLGQHERGLSRRVEGGHIAPETTLTST